MEKNHYDEIDLAKKNYIKKLVDCLESQTVENSKALLGSIKHYAKLADEPKENLEEKFNVLIELVLKKKDLSAWKQVEKLCLDIGDIKLRDRLLRIAELNGVGKRKWVLE